MLDMALYQSTKKHGYRVTVAKIIFDNVYSKMSSAAVV